MEENSQNTVEEEFGISDIKVDNSECVDDPAIDTSLEERSSVSNGDVQIDENDRPSTQERCSRQSDKGSSEPEAVWEAPPSTPRRFSCPPKEYPLTLCFEYPHTYLTHRYVFDQIKTAIQNVPYGNVCSLQFCDRNVLHNDRLLCNRWVITLSSAEAKDHLLRTGIKLFNHKVCLMPFDEVIAAEYKRFARLN